MAAGSGDFEGPARIGLTAHFFEVNFGFGRIFRRLRQESPRAFTKGHRDCFAQRPDAAYRSPSDQRSLAGGRSGQNARGVQVPCDETRCQASTGFTNRPVESELTERDYSGHADRYGTRGGQHAKRNWQVIGRSCFGKVGRSEVHRYAPAGKRITRRSHGRSDPVLGFSHGRVG